MSTLLLSSTTHVYLPVIDPNQNLNNHTCVVLYLHVGISVDWSLLDLHEGRVTATRALNKLYPDT